MLEAIGLTKRYSERVALEPLDLSIKAGDIFCLLGSNGAGKTTTINLFLGFTAPSGGKATINGLDVSAHPVETKKFIAYIPETVMLYKNLTGLENLEYFSALSGHDYTPAQLRAVLHQAGLTEADATKRIGAYSKGMRQKVGIAIAMAKDAKALLLDEPTSGLDPKASFEFSELLKSLCAKGVAILMATHDLFRAKEIATSIGVMKQGKLVAQVRSEELGHTDLEKLYLSYMK